MRHRLPGERLTGFQSGTPGPHDHLRVLPAQAQLVFGQPAIARPRTRLVVRSPSGVNLTSGTVYPGASGVAARLRSSHETGRYAVSFTVVSVDGHLTDGRYPFWVLTRATEPSSGGVVRRGLPWVLGGLPGLVIVLVRLVTVRTWDQFGTKTLWDRCD